MSRENSVAFIFGLDDFFNIFLVNYRLKTPVSHIIRYSKDQSLIHISLLIFVYYQVMNKCFLLNSEMGPVKIQQERIKK